jgi:CheY-like chemotaxis protein
MKNISTSSGATHTMPADCVLLVDDDELARPLVADLLRQAGYAVTEAANAQAAFSAAREMERLDLLVSDVVMPGLGGPQMVAQLRAERPALRVIYITGHPAGHVLSGERVLSKPFTAAQLLDIIQA